MARGGKREVPAERWPVCTALHVLEGASAGGKDMVGCSNGRDSLDGVGGRSVNISVKSLQEVEK